MSLLSKKIPLKPLFYGGGQERGLRPGTIPVPLVAGFSLAAEILSNDKKWWAENEKIKKEILVKCKTNNIKIGFRFVFQSREKTLTDKEVDKVMGDIVESTLSLGDIEIPGIKHET